MANVVVMVHGVMDLKTVPKLLAGHHDVSVIMNPILGKAEQQYIEALNKGCKFDANEVELIVLESNYGYPSQERFDEELFRYVLDTYPNATVVAYSSTLSSLIKAFTFDAKIKILISTGKSKEENVRHLEKVCGDLIFDSDRIYDKQSLKEYAPQGRPRFKTY